MTDEQYTPIPPLNYAYRGHLFDDIHEKFDEKKWRLLLWANLMALVPLATGIIFLWMPYQIYRLFGTPLALFPNPSWSWTVSIVVGTAIILGSMVLHEFLHGLALILTGHKPRFLFRMGVPFTGICQGDYLPRNHFIIVTLTPLVVMTLVGSVGLVLLPPAIGQIVLIALLLNLAASIGDILIARRLLRWPPQALFADDMGIRVFTPLEVAPEEPARQKNTELQRGPQRYNQGI